MISLELIYKIKSISNKKYFHGIIPDVYSSIINCAETENYILFFNPIIINGMSKYSNAVAFTKSDKNSNEIKNEFLKSVSSYNINNLSYSSLNICLIDSIIEAKKYSKNIPEINIKSLIDEIIENELIEYKNDKEIYNSIINDLEIFSKKFKQEKYLCQRLNMKNRKNSIKESNNFYFRIPIKYINFKCINYNIDNIFDTSIFCSNLYNRSNEFKLHNNLNTPLRENKSNIFYNINDINYFKFNKKKIFLDYYQKVVLNIINIEELSRYDEILVTNDFRKSFLKKYNKNVKNIFTLKESFFDRNQKIIFLSSLNDIELVKNIPYTIMVTYDYNEENYHRLEKKENIIYFSIKKLNEYFNIIFLDFKLDYFNKIIIYLKNKCFVFPKNRYIKNYNYLIDSIEIEDFYFIKRFRKYIQSYRFKITFS
ncbi:MAG: hypothetical protein KatS3mg068_2211 [Candidatus Sericytochromatia bacterium]|nr:MAG: hypothetical protein KatS3mg068_2211 [Candidatus Sericytochromatia bacterium]